MGGFKVVIAACHQELSQRLRVHGRVYSSISMPFHLPSAWKQSIKMHRLLNTAKSGLFFPLVLFPCKQWCLELKNHLSNGKSALCEKQLSDFTVVVGAWHPYHVIWTDTRYLVRPPPSPQSFRLVIPLCGAHGFLVPDTMFFLYLSSLGLHCQFKCVPKILFNLHQE